MCKRILGTRRLRQNRISFGSGIRRRRRRRLTITDLVRFTDSGFHKDLNWFSHGYGRWIAMEKNLLEANQLTQVGRGVEIYI